MTRRRVLVGAVVALLLLGLGDQALRVYAEHRTAGQVSCQLRAAHTHVSIAGPFIAPQLVRNRFRHVVTTSTGVRSNGVPVNLTTDLHDVHPVNASTVHSGRGRITVTVPMSSLSTSAGGGYTASDYRGDLLVTATSGPDVKYGVTVLSHVGLAGGNVLVVTPYQVSVLGKPMSFKEAERQAHLRGESLQPRRVKLPALLTDLGLQPPRISQAGLILSSAAAHYTLQIPQIPGC